MLAVERCCCNSKNVNNFLDFGIFMRQAKKIHRTKVILDKKAYGPSQWYHYPRTLIMPSPIFCQKWWVIVEAKNLCFLIPPIPSKLVLILLCEKFFNDWKLKPTLLHSVPEDWENYKEGKIFVSVVFCHILSKVSKLTSIVVQS